MKVMDLFKIRGMPDPERLPASPARRIGQLDWLAEMPQNHNAFRFSELQQEYDAGYNAERRHCQDARN